MKRPNLISMALLFAVLGASVASAEPAQAPPGPDGGPAAAAPGQLDATAAAPAGPSHEAAKAELDASAAAAQAELTRRRRGRVIGLTILSAGVAAVGVGAVFGALAYSDWRGASVACGGDTERCRTAGYALAQSQLDSARRSAAISSWSIGAGLAISAVGAAMLVASRARPSGAPRTAWQAAPIAGPQGVGLALTRSLP